MYKIIVKHSFRAAHRLLAPYKGKCNNVHGEYYTVTFELQNKILPHNKMLMDFGECKKIIKNIIDNEFDHAYLYNSQDEIGRYLENNKFKTYMICGNPTAENLCKLFYNLFDKKFIGLTLNSVTVQESSDDNVAVYVKERR